MGVQLDLDFREWRPIKGFEGLYDLRDDGLLYGHPRKGSKGGYSYGNEVGGGYLGFGLSKNGKVTQKRVNRLVWETFVGPIPEGYDIHHKNHNRQDNRLENLELVESYIHSKMHMEEHIEDIKKINSKPILQYTKNMEFVSEYPSITEAVKQTGLDESSIIQVLKGRRKNPYKWIWKYKDAS